MICESKIIFQSCLLKWKKEYFYADMLVETYLKGSEKISVKKNPKTAIKILKYWEKHCDLTKYYHFVYYGLYKVYKEINNTKLMKYYDMIYFQYLADYSSGDKIFSYKKLINLEFENSVTNGKIKDKKMFDKAFKHLMILFEMLSNFNELEYSQFKKPLVNLLSKEPYKKLYICHILNGYYLPYNRNESLKLIKQFTEEDFIEYFKLLDQPNKSNLSAFKVFLTAYYNYHKKNPTAVAKVEYAKQLLIKDDSFANYSYDEALEILLTAYECENRESADLIINIFLNKKDYKGLVLFLEAHLKKYKNDYKNAIILADIYFAELYNKEKGAKDKTKIKNAISIYEKYVNHLNDTQLDILSNVYLKGHVVPADLEKAKHYSRGNSSEIAEKERIDSLNYLDSLELKSPDFKDRFNELKQGVIDNNLKLITDFIRVILYGNVFKYNAEILVKLANILVENKDEYGCYLLFYLNFMSDDEAKKEEGMKYYEVLQKSETAYKYYSKYIYSPQKTKEEIDEACESLLKAYEMGLSLAKREYAFLLKRGANFEKDLMKAYNLSKELFLSDDYLLSSCFCNTFYVEKIEDEATFNSFFDRFKKCADEANFSGANYYTYLIGIKNKKLGEVKCVNYLKRSVELNYNSALYELGKAYAYQYFLPTISVDHNKAFELFEKSSNLNSSKLQLGHCYFEGIGTKRDYAKAFECYNEVYPNSKKAGLYLGKLYLNGYGVKKDLKKAFSYFNELEDYGGYVSFFIGTIYHDGVEGFLEPDKNKAMKLYKLALKKYDHDSVYIRIGNIHYVNDEYKKAVNNYTKALDINNKSSAAHFNLGNTYISEKNVDKDYSLAYKHYEAAYNLGEYEAALQLGEMHFFSLYKMVNEEKSFKYYKIAYDNKVLDAEVYLAHWYEFYKKDLKKAYELIKDSKSESHIKYGTLGNIYYNGNVIGIDYKKAFEYYQKSYEIFPENDYIWFRLGRCYYFGHGVERDVDRAYDFISLAQKKGNGDAIDFYEEYFKNR